MIACPMNMAKLSSSLLLEYLFSSTAETNLKKQGMLPLTFANESDYDKVQPSDRVSLLGLADLAPGKVGI